MKESRKESVSHNSNLSTILPDIDGAISADATGKIKIILNSRQVDEFGKT